MVLAMTTQPSTEAMEKARAFVWVFTEKFAVKLTDEAYDHLVVSFAIALDDARREERERCAKIADLRQCDWARINVDGTIGKARSYAYCTEAGAIAAAIRESSR